MDSAPDSKDIDVFLTSQQLKLVPCIISTIDLLVALWNTDYMDQFAPTINPPPVTPQQSALHRDIVLLVIFAVGAAIVASLGAFFAMSSNQSKQQLTSNQQPQQTNQVTQAPTEVPAQPTDAVDPTTGWKIHTNIEGKYSIQYPQDWVVEIYKDKYPYNNSYEKGFIVFQTRATTAKEKANDAPGTPVDMGTGSVKISTNHFIGGKKYADMTEQEFFNTNSQLWPKGDIGGGGPRYTFSEAQEVTVGGKRAIKQISHPTRSYEWVGPQQITTTYYVWLGNASHEVAEIVFTYDDANPNKTLFLQNFNRMVQTFKLLP